MIYQTNPRDTLTFSLTIDSVNIGENSQLGKHGFGSLHNLKWTCYLNEDILLRHWLRFTNEVDQISLNSLLRFLRLKFEKFGPGRKVYVPCAPDPATSIYKYWGSTTPNYLLKMVPFDRWKMWYKHTHFWILYFASDCTGFLSNLTSLISTQSHQNSRTNPLTSVVTQNRI